MIRKSVEFPDLNKLDLPSVQAFCSSQLNQVLPSLHAQGFVCLERQIQTFLCSRAWVGKCAE